MRLQKILKDLLKNSQKSLIVKSWISWNTGSVTQMWKYNDTKSIL